MAKITIFGMAGTGKTSAGKELAKRLGFQFFSGGDFARETARKLEVDINELDALSETDRKYDQEIDDAVEEFGKNNDNFVVECRLAWYFIPDSFKVCFVCDFDERTKRIAIREGKDLATVREETRQREDSIHERFSKYYDIPDIEDRGHFDYTVDTGCDSLLEVVESITKEIKLRRIIA